MTQTVKKTIGENTPKKHLPEALEKNIWQKGQSGNPAGRPKGSLSVMDSVRHIFETDPERFVEFVDKYLKDPRNRQHIVEMIDGKPKGSETIVPIQINFTPQDVKDGAMMWIENNQEDTANKLKELGWKVEK